MPPFLTPYLAWIKIGGLILAVSVIFGAGMWVEGKIKDTTIAKLEADALKKAAVDATTVLNQFTADVATMNKAAQDYTNQRLAYDTRFASISKELMNAINKKPLPVGCVLPPDSDRMRALTAAVRAANSANIGSGTSPAVPRN